MFAWDFCSAVAFSVSKLAASSCNVEVEGYVQLCWTSCRAGRWLEASCNRPASHECVPLMASRVCVTCVHERVCV